MKCVYCQMNFQVNLKIDEIVGLQPLVPRTLCPSCQQLFERNDQQPKCSGCDKEGATHLCLDCRYWQEQYPGLTFRHEALYKYNQEMHQWFEQYKFKGDINLGRTFSYELTGYFQKWQGWLIVPIPLSAERLATRGFNQVEVFLQNSQVAYSTLLLKKRHKKSQTSKSKVERLASKQSFVLAKGASTAIHRRKVLLVDDVYTTGRTMFHGRECLLEANPQQLMTFTLAR